MDRLTMIHYFYKLVSTVGRQKMQRRPRQRSKTEIISSILRSTGNRTGTRISQIMYETYIPHNQLKEYLAMKMVPVARYLQTQMEDNQQLR